MSETQKAINVLLQATEEPVVKVVDYQITDRFGYPIGGRTIITYSSEEELIEKFKQAHTNAVLYADRLRKKSGKK
jgi:hypothetical protein